MIAKLSSSFDAMPRWQLALMGLVLIGLIGVLDHVTGYELSFSIFYLVPIAFTAWYVGKHAGLGLCLVSTAVWLGVDYTSGHAYSHNWIPYWNAIVRFGFFCVSTYLLAEVKFRLGREKLLARVDALTGLKNAFAFKEEARLFFGLAARSCYPITLGYIDVDNFKKVNDTLGHSEGDRVLASVGTTIAKAMRSTDIAGRLGGDEFAILSPGTDMAGAQVLFEKLREKLSTLVQAQGWPIGFSVGVVVFPSPLPDPDAALHQADALMYRVKHGGKNAVCYEVFQEAVMGAGQGASADRRRVPGACT